MMLHVANHLNLDKTVGGPESMKDLGVLVRNSQVPLVPYERDGEIVFMIDNLTDGLEDSALPRLEELLHAIGQVAPGLLTGYLEIWWPYAVESGPMRLQLDRDGKLFRIESSVVWEEPEEYVGTP